MLAAAAVTVALATGWICPARFAPLPAAWAQGNLGAHTTATTTDAWAHTRGFANLNDIPRGGIYVGVLLGTRYPSSPAPTARRPLRLPLDLRHPDQIATAEGPLPEYRFAGRYHGFFVDVRVDFGRRHPTASMRRRTQTLLGRLRLPARVVAAPRGCGRIVRDPQGVRQPRLARRWSDHGAGFGLRYPAGWRVSRLPLLPLGDPVERFVLVNRLPLPGAPLAAGSRQVIAMLTEVVPPLRTDVSAFPSRPRRFRLPRLGRLEGFDGDRWTELTFRDRRRGFYLFVGVGIHAAGAVPALLASLDTLTVTAR